MDKPIANYTYGPSPKVLGYDAVGPGWRHLLEALDEVLVRTAENAVANATVARPEYREEGNTSEAAVEILQVKEKFGGLRVYFQTKGMSSRFREYIHGACSFAEAMSMQTCEKCGSRDGAVPRNKKDTKYGRILTLCTVHHQERDNLPAEQWFEFGNGDRTI